MATEGALEQSDIGRGGDFPGPLFLAVAPVEVEWPQRLELGRAPGKQDPNYDDLLRISGGGKYAPLHDRFMFGSVAARLAETFGTKGSPISLSTACASGATAIQLGVEAIRRGETDAALCVGADATVNPESMERFSLCSARSKQIPVSSNQSVVGHTISAAGAVEAIFSLLTLEHQRIPPTINYDVPDPAIPFGVVGNKARDARVTAVMSNSFGFGGQNASLILTREPI